jgi:5-(carboxyamino)imidazole ribonucleotide mutase
MIQEVFYMAKVAVIMGSDSDFTVMQEAVKTLKSFGVSVDVHVMSAHRTPREASEFAQMAFDNGFGVIIAAAGMAAHLAGAIAGNTILPVIGVPLVSGSLGGMDALLATVQMPSGIPVATVALNGAQNAAILAVQILAAGEPALWDKIVEHKASIAQKTKDRDAMIRAQVDAL